VLKSFSTCAVTLFFSQDVDFSPFFSLFSTPQKDPQNGLKMGLRAGHSMSIKTIMTNILVRSQAPQRMFILIIFDGCLVDALRRALLTGQIELFVALKKKIRILLPSYVVNTVSD
jgi:hypothetical protein